VKAIYFMQNGGPEVLQYGEQPDPVAGEGQVVVDIHAASVNGADWKTRSGYHAPTKKFPHIPGRDFSGVVSAVGRGVTDFKTGDAVFGVSVHSDESCYAEKVAINAAIITKKPAQLSHIEAAALGLIGLTAIVSIETALQVKAGQTVLVQGGAGGVASFGLQLAKHLGARVITTCSAANADYVKSLGADQVIDYNKEDFTQVVKDCDAVFDTVGGEVAKNAFKVLKRGGRAAFINGPAPTPPYEDMASLKPDATRKRTHLDRIVQLVTSGAVKLPQITTYALTDAQAAHRVSEGRHLRGKLVFRVRD
jgi:NADPH:quinone reductase-like Zn-dependent oxidoreductase